MPSTELLRVRSQRSKARGSGTPALLSVKQWEQTIADFGGLCAYCESKPFEVMEHFIPVYIAGTTVNNCIPACYDCNTKKKNHTGERVIEIFGKDTITRIELYLASRSPEGSYFDQPQSTPRKPTRKKTVIPVGPITATSSIPEKEVYAIQELFDHLSISIKELAGYLGMHEVTLARIRDGKPTYRRTANHLLKVFSRIYDNRPFYLENVTGINVAVSGKKRAKEAKIENAA